MVPLSPARSIEPRVSHDHHWMWPELKQNPTVECRTNAPLFLSYSYTHTHTRVTLVWTNHGGYREASNSKPVFESWHISQCSLGPETPFSLECVVRISWVPTSRLSSRPFAEWLVGCGLLKGGSYMSKHGFSGVGGVLTYARNPHRSQTPEVCLQPGIVGCRLGLKPDWRCPCLFGSRG